ncbi:MAG: hypothetical protein JWQ90_233, partial [Hydrocarboniphaga sp.]|nr:hypothetical protein [Hydrocarboniphaga sp.]
MTNASAGCIWRIELGLLGFAALTP